MQINKKVKYVLYTVLYTVLFLVFLYYLVVFFNKKTLDPSIEIDNSLLINNELNTLFQHGKHPNITLDSFTHQKLNLEKESFKNTNNKIILINLWASWCLPCIEEMPSLELLQNKYGSLGLHVIAINIGEKKLKVLKFIDKYPYQLNIGFDPDAMIFKRLSIIGLPNSFLFGRDNNYIGEILGPRNWNSPIFRGYFEQLLEKRND